MIGAMRLVAFAPAALAAVGATLVVYAQTPDLTETWARRGCTGGQPCPFIAT